MRIHPNPLIALLLLLSINLFGQQEASKPILLRSGAFFPIKNISEAGVNDFNQQAAKINGLSFAVIQFDKIPEAKDFQMLQAAGITLLDYLPQNAYTVSISKPLEVSLLQLVRAIAVFELSPAQKMHPLMAKGIFPSWAIKIPGTLDVWINFPKSISYETVSALLKEKNIEIISDQFKEYQVIGLRISQQRLVELVSLPFISYAEPAPHEDQPLVNVSRNNARANLLNAPVAFGGRDLRGQGITVGIGDNANATYHVDFTGRIINRSAIDNVPAHGVHVHGIVGSGGIKEEKYAGYAPKVRIVSQLFSGIIANAPAYVNDYRMVVTNNSYGAIVGDCDYAGVYDLYSYILDLQAFRLPNLQNVFSAGNSGLDICAPYPAGFKTVLGSFQSAKNVITVGNTLNNGTVFSGSSKGPVKDGRIKPEIVAMGTGVVSTWPTNNYISNTGTSMSGPAVAGGLALLYQRYRQLHNDADPKSGLMKALICNGGADVENEGPDFKSGFGWLNLLRSVDMLENNHYFISSVTQNTSNEQTITLPAGTAQLKVMLYWHDPAASVLSSQTLVNDLDLEVLTPSASAALPRILDTVPTQVNNIAGSGADHINNIEQVVINNPVAGSYTIKIKGTAINQNLSQEYFVVYDFIPVSTTLTYPSGGENLLPGEKVMINWDSYGEPSNGFTVQTSTDNGSTWTDAPAPADARQLNWTVPALNTSQAMVRIRRDGTALESTSKEFTIIGRPTISLAATQCEGYMAIKWTAVAGATQYEIMRLKGDEMVSEFITTDASALNYTINGLLKDSIYWVSVRALINGKPGRRAIAISYQPNKGTCSGIISDNDLKIDSILGPSSGRKYTYTELSANETLSVRIKNLDDAAAANFTIRYRIDGGAWISQNISSPLAGGAKGIYNFSGIDLSAIHNYFFNVEVINAAADPVKENDTLSFTIKQIDNPAINLANNFVDDFETTPEQTETVNTIGLAGADRYDFSTSTPGNGRIRSFLNSGIAHSGSKAFTVDVDRYKPTGNINYLTGTYNLQNYNVAVDDIRLDFYYKSHGQNPNENNKVWIRGNDAPSTPWLEVYDLSENQAGSGVYKKTNSIEIGDILVANGQTISPGFQVRWGQFGVMMATDNTNANGYTFDDIELYKVTDDIQLLSIDTPITASCGLTANADVSITVRNSANNSLTNIPVHYKTSGGIIVNEIIPMIAGNATMQYQFATKADLSSFGLHKIDAWVDLPSDTYSANDTQTVSLVNSPVISSFPYLENFENGNGNWYAGGENSSWEYGTPASPKINEAASGNKIWKTRLSGNYNDEEKSYLYSPCYNIAGLINPTLSFSLALDLEDCGGTACDMAFIEYSLNGKAWTRLGNFGEGTNWYNKNYTDKNGWSVENYSRWHVATIPLPNGAAQVQLRFVMESDPAVNREGIAIDDIHIYDRVYGIYDGATMTVSKDISGSGGWIDFTADGKLIASVKPGSKGMGNTAIRSYINSNSVRSDSGHYYHDRNITIQPTNYVDDSVQVRFYFLDSESESLINANGCANCIKPLHTYQLGVAGYNDINDDAENGTIDDNVKGSWSFIPRSEIAMVPFDKGYYAAFTVTHFSEFWLKKEPFKRAVLPAVKITGFNAFKKQDNDVSVEWTASAEGNANRFEIEVAKGNEALQVNNFVKIGEVVPRTSSTQPQDYVFLDLAQKTGVRYYRLKVINNDGSFFYTGIKAVVFDNEWGAVFPNPSPGNFNIQFQLEEGTNINAVVLDEQGRQVKKVQAVATGFQQKLNINLEAGIYPAGLYMIRIENDQQRIIYKVVKL
jgi:hypothetical protein